MKQKILLPIDHADKRSWEKALPAAKEQAAFHKADLDIVTVIPEIIQLPNLPANYGEGAKDYVKGALAKAIGDESIDIIVRQGSVYREILKLAYAGEYDMIVMGSSRGEFPNYETGPNVTRVMRSAHCDVLLVRG